VKEIELTAGEWGVGGETDVYCCEHVGAGGVEGALASVGQDDHTIGFCGVAAGDEELGHVVDVRLAAAEGMFATGVVDADKEGFAAHRELRGDGIAGPAAVWSSPRDQGWKRVSSPLKKSRRDLVLSIEVGCVCRELLILQGLDLISLGVSL